MILDFHSHIYPDHLAPRAIRNIALAHNDVNYYCDGTAAGLKDSMRRAGITHCVLLNIAAKPGQTESVVRFAAETMAAERLNDAPCFIPFASVHPFEDGWKDWLGRVKAMGFQGIKLHPDYQQFFVDDPAMEPFYRETARLGLILVIHAGQDLSMPELTHATTERIANVLPVLELGTTVLAHMGGHMMYRKTLELLCGRDVYMDTSYSLPHIDLGLARDIVRKHTPDRILFGADSPWCDQKQMLDYVCDRFAPGFLSAAEVDKILWNNGASLLGMQISADCQEGA